MERLLTAVGVAIGCSAFGLGALVAVLGLSLDPPLANPTIDLALWHAGIGAAVAVFFLLPTKLRGALLRLLTRWGGGGRIEQDE